ncbi:DUF3105 domain-containing protein [Glycomyces xiaoerkulensis]|uniref:DUF3105 domain-containing protein n=1 Tax=Glycomyces xiaoerkulensis TaxID=2038139 RepID=UPI000C25E47C|nr:DUF3105 domain-containing protein [Glycomyces xiaoerkulensis]
MASKKKKQRSSSQPAKNAGRKNRTVPVKQSKPWGLILTFSAVGVVAIGLIAAAAFVVWDRGQPPQGIENFYAPYESYQEAQEALGEGDATEDELENPWVLQQNHVDSQDPTAVPEYEITPPAGGNHLSNWQNCEGVVYDAPIADGNAVHSLEHGAAWLTYDPDLVDQAAIDHLAEKIEGRNFSFMSPYPGQGTEVSVQSWGTRWQTDDPYHDGIDKYLTFAIQNSDNLAEMNATCSSGVTTTTADGGGGEAPVDLEDLEDVEPPEEEG